MSTNRHLQWEEMKCCGELPAGRVGETFTTSDDQREVFLYGGMVEPVNRPAEYLDDFFAFDPESRRWTRRDLVPIRSVDAPQFHPRAFHTTVTHQGRLYIFGGCSANDGHNDVVRVDPKAGTREIVALGGTARNVPVPRYCHSAVVFEDAMYIFGGKCGSRSSDDRLADIYRFDFETATWSHVEQTGDVPPPRSAHSAVVCGRKMFIFSGRQSERGCYGDMYEYAFDTHVWCRIALGSEQNLSLERARHSAVIHNGVIAVFGGWNGRKKLNDLYLHALDGHEDDTETETATVPQRRECHAAVMWRNTMLVFSGRYRVNALDDVQALRLGPMSLVEQCRDWLMRNRVKLDFGTLPERLAQRLQAWESIQRPSRRDGSLYPRQPAIQR